LGEPIAALSDLEVNPAIAVSTREVVFTDELIRDVSELDANIFRLWHWRIQIEVLKVNGAEACTFPGEDTVEEEFDEFKRGSVSTNVARIADSVASNSDTSSIRVILLGTDFTDHHGMTNLLALVERNVLVVDEEEGVGTCYSLFCWRGTRANALA